MIWRMVGQRLALGALVLVAITLVIFGAIELLGADFAQQRLGQAATEETLAALREQTGARTGPAWVRYRQLDRRGGPGRLRRLAWPTAGRSPS